jgi:hypothetical protein
MNATLKELQQHKECTAMSKLLMRIFMQPHMDEDWQFSFWKQTDGQPTWNIEHRIVSACNT